jgi:hypothetical protein
MLWGLWEETGHLLYYCKAVVMIGELLKVVMQLDVASVHLMELLFLGFAHFLQIKLQSDTPVPMQTTKKIMFMIGNNFIF